MSAVGIDGLISGLNTTSLIDQLMTAEAAPQALLKSRVTTSQTLVTALQGLNSSIASLATVATKTALPATSDLYTATSSAPSVSVSAATGAAPGRVNFSVSAVASAQVSVSAAMTVWPDTPATFTIVGANGTKTELTAASTSLDDVVTAINGSSAGVSAIKVAAGNDSSGTAQYRLQLSSSTSGAAGAFSIYRGNAAAVTAGTATDLLSTPGAATVTAASDASVTLWAGTAAQQVITSPTNTFTNVLPGVSLTVSQVDSNPVSITVAHDAAGASNVASSLVDSLTAVFALIDTNSTVSTTTSATGATSITGGTFTGNSTVQDARQKIISAASDPVNGHSPSEIGLTLTRDGTIQYDATKFAAALAKDPTGTQSMLQTVASRIATAATNASDKYVGSITGAIKGQQSTMTELNTQISDWDVRLAAQRASLQTTYSNLEVSLSNLKAQSSWLTSQISALPTNTSTTSSSSSITG